MAPGKTEKAALTLAAFFSVAALAAGAAGQSLTGLDQELSQVISRISPAVVVVEARTSQTKAPLFSRADLNQDATVSAVVGSGLLIDSIGHVLTIFSLVEGNEDIKVEVDGKTVDARLMGVDRRHDLAVLKIEGVHWPYLERSAFPPFIGRLALAYGRAIDRTGYPTLGIIAGRRSDGAYLMSGSALPGLLGGGVFDLNGNLIGIITSGSIDDEAGLDSHWGGMLLLPAATAFSSADRIICCGGRAAGYLGIETAAIELVSAAGKVVREAVVITAVDPGSPADKARLAVGDIITRFARQDITDDRELQRLVATSGTDSLITIEFIHGQADRTADIRLAPNPHRTGPPRGRRLAADGNRTNGLPDEIQRRIDSMRIEIRRLQTDLEQLLRRIEFAR